MRESQKKAVEKYQKANTKLVQLRFNFKYDADILQKFQEVSNVTGYIKNLVRADIKESENDTVA